MWQCTYSVTVTGHHASADTLDVNQHPGDPRKRTVIFASVEGWRSTARRYDLIAFRSTGRRDPGDGPAPARATTR